MLVFAFIVVAVVAGPAFATPESSESSPTLAAATDRAIELERSIENHRADMVALEERVEVTDIRIRRQQEVLNDAQASLDEARMIFEDRIIRMYKSSNSSMAILLTSESISDFYARALMLTRIAQHDRNALSNASLAASQAEYEAAFLDDLRAQEVALRKEMEFRSEELAETLVEQKALVEQLTQEEEERLEAERAAAAARRTDWLDNSVPIGATVPLKPAIVEPYLDRSYLVPEHQPDRYRTTGRTMIAVCSWYGNEFNGRPTASGQIFNEEDLTCASKTLPFGTTLALTRDNKRIIVIVNDRGPFIAGRDLDLSKAAARELGFSGVEPVHAEFVEVAE